MLIEESDKIDDLVPPMIPGTLPDITGGEENLLPAGVWTKDLRVEFAQWQDSNPSPGNSEILELNWDGNLAGAKSWEGPIPPTDRFIMVPMQYLTEGAHGLYYRVKLVNGDWTRSDDMTVTIDKTAPVINSGIAGKLIFPQEVIDDGITDHYLAAHGEEVLAEVPAWDAPQPGDVISWYWSDDATSPILEAGTKILQQGDGPPFRVAYPGKLIRDNGDGQRFATYFIKDRAGNSSPFALPVALTADTKPVPRDLPWPVIEEATGTGQTMILLAEDSISGAVVRIPDTAVIYPGEPVWVQWGDPADVYGSYRADVPITPGGRRFSIPMKYVAAHLEETLPVYYQVEEPLLTWTSDERTLSIRALPLNRLPTIQCPDADGQYVLRYSQVPANGARLRLDRWVMMTIDQCVTFKMTGVTTAGTATEYVALDKHRVTSAELTAGIGSSGDVTVPKNFLNTLRRNAKFSLTVYVTFAAGPVCPPPGELPNFPVLELTLVD